ncbi:Dna2-domain-containing protein, partial [Thozetella sp. PMI_491]
MPLERSSTDLSRRKRTQWQRSNSHPTGQHTALRPIPVSKSTKNKLDSFRAPKPDDTAAGDDPAAPRDAGKASPRSSRLDKENRHADETKATVKTNTASTPIGRLAWEDIMGNVDDKKDDEDSSSPSDRIGWDHARSSLSMTPVVSRKGKKRARARSSSPTVSPASSKRTPATPAVDSAKLASVLKTPHADPILELWDRCAVSGTENTSPSGLTNPLLAQCMISSSPRPTDGNRSHERPLRKSMSYGPSFKRRKMDKFGPTALAALQRSPQPNSKLSMVSALLKTVDGEIQKSTLEAENRSSPSPSPERRPAKLDRLATQDEAYLRDSGRAQPVQLLLPVAGATVTTKNMDKSSDYGDDFDFDEETLMELDTGLQILKEDDRIQTPPPEPTRQEQPQSAVTPAPPQMMGPSKLDDDDEFDDLDDEIFDGAEDLMVEVESAFPSQAGVQPPIQSTLHQASGAVMHQHAEQQGEDDYGDAFEDDFDFEAAELVATQSATAQKSTALPHPSQKPKTIQRYKINRVMDAPYVNDQGRESLEKILVVQSDGTNSIKTIHLRDDWMDTPATVGSYVHVVGEFESSGSCFVTNNQNMLILHPDQLISSTVVGDSFNCTRQAVLEDRVKATSDLNPPLVYGTILHEIFQEALMANKWDTAFLGSLIAKILNNHLEKLYTIKVSIPEARDHLLSKMGELRSWARVFVS